LTLKRKRPLTISRGTSGESENLLVTVSADGIDGTGESAPIGYAGQETKAGANELALVDFRSLSPWQIAEIEQAANEVSSSAKSALICACYDWLGKRVQLPVYKLLGLSRGQQQTSITVGINPPEVVSELAPQLIRETGTPFLKLKLGNPAGVDADKESFSAAREACPAATRIRVDANGGWTVSDAVHMVAWLQERGCDYLEQPLPIGSEEGLAEIRKVRTIPVFIDEYISSAKDVVKFAGLCDGVNVKLMKSGGLAEALRIVHVARAHGLQTMIGCFGESSIGISAAAAMGSLFDHVDLDSHLNLDPDPAVGLAMENGRHMLSEEPGFGTHLV
jgi:muconate cycloisomerase